MTTENELEEQPTHSMDGSTSSTSYEHPMNSLPSITSTIRIENIGRPA